MKNILLGIATFSLLFLTSCSKEESSSLELDQSKSATVQGLVKADLDLTEAGYENAPVGTKLIITIENSEYLAGATGSSTYETTVDNYGGYSINLPVNDNGIEATFFPDDFEFEQEVEGDDERVIFTASPFSITLYPGSTYIRDVQY